MQKKMEARNSLKSLKIRNRKLVLALLRNSGSVSVNEISKATGLSKMTVHKIIDYYVHEGMVKLVGKGDSTEEGGKKPNLFAFNPNCRYLFLIRLDKGYFAASIVNLKGDFIADRVPTEIAGVSFAQAMELARDSFATLLSTHNLSPDNCLAAVLGCNGMVDVKNGICLAIYQYPQWGTNIPVRETLSALLPPNIPVYVDNWWRHLAHGEILGPDGERRKRFFLIGNDQDYISGGMVADGRILHGATGFIGEIGHMVVDKASGVKCVCGGVGCLEAMVAPSRLVARARDAGVFTAGALPGTDDVASAFAALTAAADNGDDRARALVSEAAGHFAVAINNIVQTCDPGTIVLYGEYARAGNFFMDSLRDQVQNLTMIGIDKRTRIECSGIDNSSAAVGAAYFIADSVFSGGA